MSEWREKRAAKPVGEYITSETGSFRSLLQRARELQRLDRAVRAQIDPALAPHVRLANVRDGKLILVTPVAPIAQRLKMETPNLLERLRQNGLGGVSAIEVKVAPMPSQLMEEQ